MITRQMNSKSNIKQYSDSDIPAQSRQPVLAYYGPAESTSNQTVINLGFSIDTVNNPKALIATVDGKVLTQGSAYDFNFTSIDNNGFSSQITLNAPITAGLNIQAWKLGLKKESELGVDVRFNDVYSNLGESLQGYTSQAVQMTATPTTGSPAVGTFHSTILNRSAMTDLRSDLRARIGSERIMTPQVAPIFNEMGPNGEIVFGIPGDTMNRVRLVGSWSNQNNVLGAGISSGSNTTDYIEVVFYGTGLNILNNFSSAGYDIRTSIDGGAEGANAAALTYVTTIFNRGYAPNQILNVASGLPLGLHTAKIRQNASGSFRLFGIEVISATANLTVNPGVGYIAGKKITTSAQSSASYNSTFESGTLGTRGGRVLVYQKSDGAIAKAVTPTNASQANMTSADHSNEEIARTINWREFSGGRSDDFQIISTSPANYAYTADDNTTSLSGSQVYYGTGLSPLFLGSSGFMEFTFVGTGLDIIRYDSATLLDTITISVDGTTVSTSTVGVNSVYRKQSIVSGLPYGTHVVKITRSAAVNGTMGVTQFIVYQPKKPALPSGAIELADYNILANWAQSTTAIVPASGVISKGIAREAIFTGTWAGITNRFNDVSPTYQTADTTTVGAAVYYTFYGTGIDFSMYYSNNPCSVTVAIDGSNYTGAATVSNPTFMQWTPGTSNAQVQGGGGGTLSIQGLTLGIHTLRLTVATIGGSATLSLGGFGVTTPTHSYKNMTPYEIQNTLMIGSNSISDNRKLSAVKDPNDQASNVSQAFGISSNPTTTSTVAIPLPEMNVSHSNRTGRIKVSYSAIFTHSTTSDCTISVYLNNELVGRQKAVGFATASAAGLDVSDVFVIPAPVGINTVHLMWQTSSGTLTANSDRRNLLVEEVK